jgi:multiple sugar transport system substrate-binding protein
MATIKDIARAAGVAQGTVSNVLNNTGKVSADKIRRVEEAIARLGYVPNVQASLLRQGASKVIAIIVPTLREVSYWDFYTAVQASIVTAGFETRLYTTDDADSIEIALLEKVRVSGIAAILTVSTLCNRCCEIYQSMPCPVIYVERKPQQIRPQDAFYGFDTVTIVRDHADMLTGSGWKQIAVFMSPKQFLHQQKDEKVPEDPTFFNGINLTKFVSDYNLSLATAFEIVQAVPSFDAIICVGSTYTSAIETALSVSKPSDYPQLFSICNSSMYQSRNHTTYELDYHQLGISAAKAIFSCVNDAEKPALDTILPPNGFRFRFPQVSKIDATTISMYTLDNPSTNALRKLIPMFEAISGVKVDLVCASYEELHTQLESLTQASPYDIIRIDMADFQQLGSSLFHPLSQILPLESLHEQLRDGNYERYTMVDGIPYALPFDPSVMLFLYRQDLFSNSLLQRAYYEEHHEKLEIPTSIEQYIRIAEFFTRSVNDKSPTEFGSTTTCGSDATFASDFLPFYLGSGGRIADNTILHPLNSPEIVAAMQQYKELQQYTSKQQWWRDSLQQFASGHVAMTIAYSNYVSDVINSRYSSVVGKAGAALIPGGHPLLGGGVIGVSRFSQKQEACRQFLNWFYSDDVASLIVRLGGTSPIVSAYRNSGSIVPYPWLAAKEQSIARGTRGTDDVSVPGFSIRRYEFAIGTAIQKMVLEDLPPEHAAVMAQTLYDYSK